MTEKPSKSERTQPRTRGENRPMKRAGRWTIRWYDEHGTHRRETFSDKTEASERLRAELVRIDQIKAARREAKRAHERALRDAERLGLPPPVVEPVLIPGPAAVAKPKQRHTFKELVEYWIAHREKRSKVDDASIIGKHLAPRFAHLAVEDITTELADGMRVEKMEELSPKTVNNILTLLIALLNQAHEIGWLDRVPRIRKPKIGKMNSRDYKWLKTEDDVRRFLEAARAEEDPTVFYLYATAIFTGLRAGELAGLRWSDIDLERNQIHVKRSFDGPTKSGDDRIVPVLEDAHKLLAEWKLRSPRDPVFSSQRGSMFVESARIFQEVLHRVLKRGGFEPGYVVFHSLRHTFASWWVIQGGDLYKLQAILGHSDPKITMRYAHLSPTAFVEDHQRLSGFLPKDRVADVIKIG